MFRRKQKQDEYRPTFGPPEPPSIRRSGDLKLFRDDLGGLWVDRSAHSHLEMLRVSDARRIELNTYLSYRAHPDQCEIRVYFPGERWATVLWSGELVEGEMLLSEMHSLMMERSRE